MRRPRGSGAAAGGRPTVVQVLDFVPDRRRTMEEFLLRLAGRLDEAGWRSVHVFAGEPAGYFAERLAELGSRWMVAEMPLTVGAAVELGRQLRAYAPRIVQTSYLSKYGVTLPALRWASGTEFLVVADRSSSGVGEALRGERAAGWRRVADGWRGRVAGTYVDRLVAVSEFVGRRNVEGAGFPAGRVRVVHNGVDVERFAPAGRERGAGAGRRRRRATVAYAGQLIAHKGVMTLLRAVAKLRCDAGVDVEVLVAGRGEQREALERYCAANGLSERVRFLGQVEAVSRVFAEADVVVVPSEWGEAFGFVVAEAMACGACVLASDAGGIPEVVGEDGEAGVIFRRGVVEDLAGKLKALLGDAGRRRRMGWAARERVAERFTLDGMVDGYLGVYEELVRGELRAGGAREDVAEVEEWVL